jgi:hypothetical protein
MPPSASNIRSLLKVIAGSADDAARSTRTADLLKARRAMIDARPGLRSEIPLITPRDGVWPSDGRTYEDIENLVGMVQRGDVRGVFSPSGQNHPKVGIVAYRQGDRGTRRHEVMHGYTEAAGRGYPGMPPIAQLAASLPRALGVPLEEIVATQAGGRSALVKNWPWYSQYYARSGHYGPAATYAGMGAAQLAVPVAAGYGAGMLARQVMPLPPSDDEEGGGQDALLYEEYRRRPMDPLFSESVLAALLEDVDTNP